MTDLQLFYAAYIECALWADEPEDESWCMEDLSPEAVEKAMADCSKFLYDNRGLIGDYLSEAGHCFWLSRNGHGSNFLDSEYWDDVDCDTLHEAASKFGKVDMCKGDDGKIYFEGG